MKYLKTIQTAEMQEKKVAKGYKIALLPTQKQQNAIHKRYSDVIHAQASLERGKVAFIVYYKK